MVIKAQYLNKNENKKKKISAVSPISSTARGLASIVLDENHNYIYISEKVRETRLQKQLTNEHIQRLETTLKSYASQ
jgi:hypothetical protein